MWLYSEVMCNNSFPKQQASLSWTNYSLRALVNFLSVTLGYDHQYVYYGNCWTQINNSVELSMSMYKYNLIGGGPKRWECILPNIMFPAPHVNFKGGYNKNSTQIYHQMNFAVHTCLDYKSLHLCSADVNECLSNGGLGPCQQACTNVIGSFYCSCYPGYTLTGYSCTGK